MTVFPIGVYEPTLLRTELVYHRAGTAYVCRLNIHLRGRRSELGHGHHASASLRSTINDVSRIKPSVADVLPLCARCALLVFSHKQPRACPG